MKKDDVCGCLGPVVKGGLLYFPPEKPGKLPANDQHSLLSKETLEKLKDSPEPSGGDPSSP